LDADVQAGWGSTVAVEGDVTVLDERERSHGRKIVSTFQMSVGGINSCRVNLADFISISFVYNVHTENTEAVFVMIA